MESPLKDGVSSKNTIAEITSWLDEHEIKHDGISKKSDLLALVNEVM
ncbi:hypothetical protein FG876_02565 [Pediococcus acidilactici]|uniref:HeH/LEM domain-containing protein n=1 Tax=Pediococcus pentosaceus TaxID=1255 RepID=A0ABQ6XJR7_PEDPE|nr:hypothetical protein GBO26_09395 [Pediococcus pentosaceus]MBW9306197.1 hypothetical protein [Pediococcus acidilactici]KAF0415314.1 hypothetical protein GBO79_01915 [Pediococcus pentosaceus]KAF0502807.1 hypothetical protein GBP22_05235 [Pediococcus pentosaceus]MCQ0053552.1 hypothetical protein [Pediococcus acidilactici]